MMRFGKKQVLEVKKKKWEADYSDDEKAVENIKIPQL
jgi:hypothetical protein